MKLNTARFYVFLGGAMAFLSGDEYKKSLIDHGVPEHMVADIEVLMWEIYAKIFGVTMIK